jgi:hypothetical protein
VRAIGAAALVSTFVRRTDSIAEFRAYSAAPLSALAYELGSPFDESSRALAIVFFFFSLLRVEFVHNRRRSE